VTTIRQHWWSVERHSQCYTIALFQKHSGASCDESSLKCEFWFWYEEIYFKQKRFFSISNKNAFLFGWHYSR